MPELPHIRRLPPYVLLDWGTDINVYDEAQFLTHLIPEAAAERLRALLLEATASAPSTDPLQADAAQAEALCAFMATLPLPPVRTALAQG